MDHGWGECYLPPTQPGNKHIGCNCDALNDHGSSDFKLGFFKVPLTFTSFLAFVLFFSSCAVECMHWNPYWKWRNDGGLSDNLLTDQPVVVPMATVAQPGAGGKDPTETQSNPLSSQEVIPTSSEAPGDGDAAAPWTLPEDRCCSSQFSVWGIASPQTHLQALRQQHESRHGTATDDQSTEPAEGTAATDPTKRFFPPTVEGAAAFKQSLQQAHAREGKDLDKKQWARAGCTLACNWIRLHPTVASAILLMLSFWVGDSSNLFLVFVSYWLSARIYCSQCSLCWCAPAGRCKCKRTATDPKCCSWNCCCSYLGVILMCFPFYVISGGLAPDCVESCALTGWKPGWNAMETPIQQLLSPEYYGLYRDFLDQGFTQPCVLTGAIDQLIGPDGAVREALVENHKHWNIPVELIDEEMSRTKGWIVRRGANLRSAVETRCDTMPEECLGRASCLTGFQCSGTDERCEQGSLLPTCVNATDACGCTSGGWSSSHQCCLETGSTSKREADACAAGSLGVPLGAACSDGHYDWCGCEPGSGWSSGGACCSPSSSSSASELETCRASIGRFATTPREGPKC